MGPASRRLVSRVCMVCDWSGESVEQATRDVACPYCHAPTRIVREELLVPIPAGKNPIASALGRLGGSKGGKARAERLSSSRRREIARAAAQARWRRRR
jgi:DNA-directed RNA polymerase subunit RPC12/RpoP